MSGPGTTPPAALLALRVACSSGGEEARERRLDWESQEISPAPRR